MIHKELKKLINDVTFSIRKSKNKYFKSLLGKNGKSTTLIWKRISQLITQKSKNKVYPNIVKVKGKCITNPTGISDAFSKSFIEIGHNQKLS